MYSFGAVRGYAEMNRLARGEGRDEGEEWGPHCRHRGLGAERGRGAQGRILASPRPPRIALAPSVPVPSDGGWWNLAKHRWGPVGWGKQPCDAGERVGCVELELCGIYSFFCVVFAAAGIHGLIRVTNNDETCDLSESLGCNYVGHQVKESLLD